MNDVYISHEMNVIYFEQGEVWTWLVDDGSNMEVESVAPSYSDK